jgi:alanyl-tRNA synthetase
MARERGYTVDILGFESALGRQREQSQAERKSKKLTVEADGLSSGWELYHASHEVQPDQRPLGAAAAGGGAPGAAHAEPLPDTRFVGYDTVEIETQVTAMKRVENGRVAILLRETPFYAESGGQVSDHGEIVGKGWRVDVDDVKKFDGRIAAVGRLTGTPAFGPVAARVPTMQRKDTERNHTATHLLHAALREVLGDHVHQAGSLVAPDRLRFDFTHHGPIKAEALAEIEEHVNRGIFAAVDVRFEEKSYRDAVAEGAMALFGEKYGDVVRMVKIPGLSVELCGGTHVRNTAEIALFRILSETGVAAGVRRIEAATGPRAWMVMREHERTLQRVGELLKATPETVLKRTQALIDERKTLEKRLEEAMKGGTDQVRSLVSQAAERFGLKLVSSMVAVPDAKSLQSLGDAVREQLGSGVGALGATFEDGKSTLLVVATDDARDRGARADVVVRELATIAGGRGGGKPHMAQAGIPDAARLPAALGQLADVVGRLVGNGM